MRNRIANDDILDTKGNKKLGNDCGHAENEWGVKESEENEWEQYYHERNKKWQFKDKSEDEEF